MYRKDDNVWKKIEEKPTTVWRPTGRIEIFPISMAQTCGEKRLKPSDDGAGAGEDRLSEILDAPEAPELCSISVAGRLRQVLP